MSDQSHWPSRRTGLMEGWGECVDDGSYIEQMEAYADIVLDLAADNSARIVELIPHYARLPPTIRTKLLEEILILSGAQVEDPRIQAIDLRGKVHVMDGEGRLMPEAGILLQGIGKESLFGSSRGVLRFLAGSRAFEAEIRASGFEPRRVRLQADGPNLVTLTRSGK